MIVPKELSAETLARLKKIDSMHGAQKPFLTKSGIDRRTFKDMIRNGYAWENVVARAEAALAEDVEDPTVDSLLKLIAEDYKTTTIQIKAPKTKEEIEARQVAVFALIVEMQLSPEKAGAQVGLTRTGAIKAHETISNRMSTESAIRRRVWGIIARAKSK
jgi:hypothetical protein